MTDSNSTHIGGDVNVTGGDFVAGDKHIHQAGSSPAELTPEQLAAVESRYRAQVAERYNRLGFAGLGIGDTRLSDVALDDVFVRLTLTVEKIVREPIPPEEEPPSLTLPPLWGKGTRRQSGRAEAGEREGERRQERVITIQEPITLGDALTQHALIVGEPGAGKSTLLRWLAVTFAAGRQREADRLGPQADADRLPLLVELGRLPEAYLQADSRETPKWKVFLPDYLTKHPAFDDIPAALLVQALAAGRCLLLCDGLDEIADLSARRRLADSLAGYARNSQNRLVLSSRPAGVSGSEGVLGPRFQRLTIERFMPEDVRRFFGFLYALDSELTAGEQEREANALFRAVEGAPKTLELATTPLLATLLFSLWNENGYLPERRVELYELCCRMLIESWEAQHDVAYTGVLADIGWERHLRLLAPLAYAIHNGGQRTDAPAGELIPVLARAMQEEGLAVPPSATLEAEKFLRTLSLRSGLLQFLGADRYGFPHLTFQEYLTARHIAAQPDPDYIDLVMVDLHKAWWREVHLLVIGHLGSGSAGAEKATRLMLQILDVYPAPWRFLRSQRFTRWMPKWLKNLVDNYKDRSILRWPVYTFAFAIAIPPALPLRVGDFLSARMKWQWERRLAWVLAREFSFAAASFFDCSPLGTNAELRGSLAHRARLLVGQIALDPGWIEPDDVTPLKLAASSLVSLGQSSAEVVSALVAALGDSEWLVKQAAADLMKILGQLPAAVVAHIAEAQVAELGDSSGQVRQAAARSLGALGHSSAETVSALVAALGDSSELVRQAAASILGDLGQSSAETVSALVAALGDSDYDVRRSAAGSLGELGHSSEVVVAALVSALTNSFGDLNGFARGAAAESLGLVGQGSPIAVSALLTALSTASDLVGYSAAHNIRLSAVKGLGQIGQNSDAVLAALLHTLSNYDFYSPYGSVRLAATTSLGQLGNASKDVVLALAGVANDSDSYGKQAAIDSLMKLSQSSRDVVLVLMEALGSSNPTTRQTAASSLGKLSQHSPEITQALIGVLNDSDWVVRYAAAESLGRLGQASGEVVISLGAALSDSDDYVRQAAASGLVQLGHSSPQVATFLVDALGASDWRVRQAAASSLGIANLASEVVTAALVNVLGDSNPSVKEAAVISLGLLGQASSEVVSSLTSLLDDRNVRKAAVVSLIQLGQESPEIVAAWLAILSEMTIEVPVIGQVVDRRPPELSEEPEGIVKVLVSAMNDSDVNARRTAVYSLARFRPASREAMTALLCSLSDSDSKVREAISVSLGQLKIEDETQLRYVLIALNRCLHDRDDDVRRAALTAIRRLLDGRQIPGYRWVPIRERRERARRWRIFWYWVLGISLAVLVAWVAAGLTTYLSLDEFWVRFVGALAALVALAAGAVQVLGWFRRPPWER